MNIDQPTNPENKEVDYVRLLQSIERNNGRLKFIAHRLLERPDLIKLVKARADSSFAAYGVNSIRETETKNIDIKGITLNPHTLTEEVAVHEVIHFFSMPALYAAYKAEQVKELEKLSPQVQIYWTEMKRLWSQASSHGYRATNALSMTHDMTEFAVNFTNEESEEQLRNLHIYEDLVNTFFTYYTKIGIREKQS